MLSNANIFQVKMLHSCYFTAVALNSDPKGDKPRYSRKKRGDMTRGSIKIYPVYTLSGIPAQNPTGLGFI